MAISFVKPEVAKFKKTLKEIRTACKDEEMSLKEYVGKMDDSTLKEVYEIADKARDFANEESKYVANKRTVQIRHLKGAIDKEVKHREHVKAKEKIDRISWLDLKSDDIQFVAQTEEYERLGNLDGSNKGTSVACRLSVLVGEEEFKTPYNLYYDGDKKIDFTKMEKGTSVAKFVESWAKDAFGEKDRSGKECEFKDIAPEDKKMFAREAISFGGKAGEQRAQSLIRHLVVKDTIKQGQEFEFGRNVDKLKVDPSKDNAILNKLKDVKGLGF